MGRLLALLLALFTQAFFTALSGKDVHFEVDAPSAARVLSAYHKSEAFTSTVKACFPNATSPFAEFDQSNTPASQCFLNDHTMSENVEALGESLANPDVIVELQRIASGIISPHLLMDLDWEIPLISTFIEIFFGGSHFQPATESGHGSLKPRFWISPSPIGMLAGSSEEELPGAPNIILGGTCSKESVGGIASLKLDFTHDERVNHEVKGQEGFQGSRARIRRRHLMESRPSLASNISDLVIDVRVVEPGPSAVTGVGSKVETSQWENKVVEENLQQSETQENPGEPYPRTHFILYYRADWFQELNISAPNTWDELIFLAEALPGIAGFEGSTREAGPEDFPDWDFGAFPDIEFTPLEPQEVLQALPLNMTGPKERAASNSSLPRYALCLDLAPRCKSGNLFDAIFASLSQARGTWQGAFIDPIDTQLLGQKHPELVREALQLFHRITKASHQPSSVHSCAAVNPMFASGACAMTVDWDLFFPYFYNELKLAGGPPQKSKPYAEELVGNLGAAPMPGSTRVYDRKKKQMVDCDVSTCPMATRETVAEYQSDVAQDGTLGLTAQFSDVLVNRAPLSVNVRAEIFFCNVKEGETGPGLNIPKLDAASRVVNGIIMPIIALEIFRGQVLRASLQAMGPEVVRQAYSLVTKHDVDALRGLFQNHPALLSPPELPSAPLRSWWAPDISNLSPLYTGAVALTGIHLNVNDSKRYFDALWKARYTYRNQAPELWVTRTLTLAYRHAVDETAVYATASPGFSLQAGAKYFQKRCNDARSIEEGSTDLVQDAIWYTTGFDESMIEREDDEDAQSDESAADEGSKDWVAGVVAGPVAGAVLVVFSIATVAAAIYKQKKSYLNWLGKVVPPKAGPRTTLVCTDIENSTFMWELLSEDICDKAISLHNEVIRSLLSSHRGYECGTEGDAFVLAFHSAEDAVMFSSDVQKKLMLAPWPQELFSLESFRPVYVQPGVPQKLCPNFLDKPKKTVQFEAVGPEEPPVKAGQVFDRDGLSLPARLPTAPSSSHSQQDPDGTEQASSEYSKGSGLRQLRNKLLGPKQPKQEDTLASALRHLKGLNPRRSDGDGTPMHHNEDTCKDMDLRESHCMSGLLSMDTALMEALKSETPGRPGPKRGRRESSTYLPLALEPRKTVERSENPSYSPRAGVTLDPDKMELTQVGLPTGTNGAAIPLSASDKLQPYLNPTIGQRMHANVPKADGPGPGRLLVFRGLRVRMGTGTGVERVQMNLAQGRLRYDGHAISHARAIVDAAHGGQVLIGPETFQQLPPQQGKVFVVSMGEHVLNVGSQEATLQLYQVLPSMLCGRVPHLGPVRSLRPLSLDFLSAPANAAAVCFMSVSCLHCLRIWNPEVTDKSLALYHSTVQELLTKRGGYLVEASDGLCLTAFTHPASAIRWAVESLEACMNADWPDELLNDGLGEEQSIPQQMLNRSGPENIRHSFSTRSQAELEEKLVFRGLRLKVGIDWGSVKADIHPASARVSFRGKVMNRAARVSGLAKSGQVLCTERAWSSALTEYNVTEAEDEGRGPAVSAYFAGSHKLKGIQESINLYQCISPEVC